jgi:hypothetical protein
MLPARAPVRFGLLVVLIVAALLVARRGRSTKAFATAAECLDAYSEACRRGDVENYLACLEGPLRERMRRRFRDSDDLAEYLRREMRDLKSWVQVPESDGDDEAVIAVEEVRSTGTRRIRFRLVRGGSTWRIAAIDAPQNVPAVVPYGTPVSGT